MKKVLAILLVFCMSIAMAGCGDEATSSELDYDVNYGNEEIGAIEDDGDTVVVEKDETTVIKGSAAEYDFGDIKLEYGINESKKTTFLESVPKKLSGQEVSILIWWNPFDYEKQKWKKFEEATGIKIKPIYVTNDEYMQRLSALKASGNSPDIANIRSANYPSAIMQDYFQPLSNGKLSLDPKVFDIETMDKLKWNGKRYGAIVKGTTYITMALMLYNADMFNKYGVTEPYTLWKEGKWTWDTMVSTAKTIQTKSGVTALTAEYHGWRLAQTCGEDAVAIKNGKLTNNLNSSTYRNALKWINDLQMNGQHKIADFGINRAGFMSGKAAMQVDETWALQAGERYKDVSFTLGYVPLPCKTNKTVVPAEAQLWGFPVGAKHTEAAGYVLEYWHNPQFNEAGYEIWINDSVASFVQILWEQPKALKTSSGVVEYGGDYTWDTMFYDTAASSRENIDSVIDKWSGVIDANIKKIYKEFG